jgi:DNA-binding SARP family transcriptional activator
LAALGQAFALGRENGNYSTWGPPRPSDVARLCRKALEAGLEVDYVQEFIRRFRLVPDRTAAALEEWPWPLRIYCLGRFVLVKDGKPVQFSGKIQKKPLLLLKALVALGGKNVAEERLTDILWPEADGDRACSALTTTLFRLRRLIGENMLEVQNGGVSLNPKGCWVDAWTFEILSDTSGIPAGAADSEDGRSDGVSRLEKALDLYRGPFLAEEGGGLYWALPYREKLKGRFIRVITRLGRSLENKGLWDQAVSCYQKGLEADNLAEEFYRRLMTCYVKLGDTVQAARVYRSLKDILSSALGVAPSPGTETLYRRLIACQPSGS